MTGPVRALTSSAVVAGLLLSLATPPPAGAGVEVPSSRDLFVIHDSVVLNARHTIRHNLDSWDIEYLGFHGMQAWAANQFLDSRRTPIPDTVVVALNFNNRSREQLRQDFSGLLARLAPAERIVWVLPGIYGPHMIPVRETALEVVAGDPRVEVVDWHDGYKQSPGITDFLGVHLSPWGAWVYAKMIDRVLDHAPPGDPPSRGDVGGVASAASGEVVTGWALDLGTADPVRVDVYVDGRRRRRVLADRPRQDVAAVYGLGAAHGFRAGFGLDDGEHQVCVLTTAADGRGMQSLGCRILSVRHDPVGQVSDPVAVSGGVTVKGWTFDPDRAGPISVHTYLDGAFVGASRAANQRLDVAAVHPGRTRTGFRVRLDDVDPGREVCAYAIGQGRGGNEPLGCRTT
ncbi:MAG: hypothetical protein OES57_04555 [Acidimicrobiia bacterium]|nr:hypothetical protein [Acidimicrobiia bacterium]